MRWERKALFTGHRAGVHALQATANPHLFLSASGDGKVVRWDMRSPENGELVADALKAIYAIHYDVERKLLFIGNEDGGLHVVDLVEREELRLLQAHKRGIFRITPFGSDRIVCSGGDGSITVWKIPSMELERQVPLSDDKIRGSAKSADGRWLAVACLDGRIRILDAHDLNERHTLEGHTNGAASVCWHPRKPVLISGGRDGHLRVWRTDAQFKPLQAIPAHRANIYDIAFNADATLMATASRDKTVKLWDGDTLDPMVRIELKQGGHTHSVNDVLWCANGLLLSASDDKTIRAWSAAAA